MNRFSHIVLTLLNVFALNLGAAGVEVNGGGWLWLACIWISGVITAVQVIDLCFYHE